MNKVIVKESKPILFVLNYMLYAFVLGIVFFWIYVNEYSGKIPPVGTFYVYVKDVWIYFTGLAGAPIGLKILTKYLEIKKIKEQERTQSRRTTDRKTKNG